MCFPLAFDVAGNRSTTRVAEHESLPPPRAQQACWAIGEGRGPVCRAGGVVWCLNSKVMPVGTLRCAAVWHPPLCATQCVSFGQPVSCRVGGMAGECKGVVLTVARVSSQKPL